MTDDEAAAERAKLLIAADEMRAVMDKHGIVGVLALAGQRGRSEAVTHLQAPWFKAQLSVHGGGPMLRITSKLADYAGDKKAKHRDMVSTMAALSSVAEILARNGYVLLTLSKSADDTLGAESTPLVPDDPKH